MLPVSFDLQGSMTTAFSFDIAEEGNWHVKKEQVAIMKERGAENE